MDIMALGAIGELVGGVAVVASLIFVGLQVRGSTREQKISSMREATRETAGVVQFFREPGRAEIWLQGMSDFASLKPPDRVRFSAILVHWFRMFEQLYYQNRDGQVDFELWRGFEHQLRDLVANPGFHTWWPERGHWFGEGFREFVESHMGADNPTTFYEKFTRL